MDLSAQTRWRARDVVGNEANAVVFSVDLIRDLALRCPDTPVLSVYVRTDPRDPANTAAVPGWLVERAVEQAVISGAEVTVLAADTPELARAGGAGAILRY